MARGRNKGGLDISGIDRRPRHVGRNAKKGGLTFQPRPSNFSSRTVPGAAPSSGRSGPRLGTVLKVVVGIVVALAIASAVGVVVYQQTVRNALKAELDLQALGTVLEQPADASGSSESAYWNVLVQTDASSAEEGRGDAEDLALVYVDPDNKSLSVLWVPTDTRVYIDGYGYHEIGDAFSLEGETGVVSALGKLGGVAPSHYFELNRSGYDRLLSDLEPLESSGEGRDGVLASILKRACGSSGEQVQGLAEFFAADVASDMDADGFASVLDSLRGMDVAEELHCAEMPSATEAVEGETYAVVKTDEWNSMVARVASGRTPLASQQELRDSEFKRSNCTVTIWNGVGVSGIANDCSEELKRHGWQIESVGNAQQFVYQETLVVYKGNDDEALADLLVTDLGQGRAVRSAARYSFAGDVLVVLGKDYQPY